MQFEFNLTLIDWLLFEFNCKNILELFCVQCMSALYIHQIFAIDQGNFLLLFLLLFQSNPPVTILTLTCVFSISSAACWISSVTLLDEIRWILKGDNSDDTSGYHNGVYIWTKTLILIELYQIKRLVLDIVGNSDVLYNINKIPWK